MKFSVQRENLLKPLQNIVGVVERRQTLPVLSNVLVSANENSLSMTTTDLEVEMVTMNELDIGEGGTVTVPARKFFEICRALPEASNIEFTVDNNKQRATIKSGKSRFSLATLPADEFPNIEKIKSTFDFSCTQHQLKQLIENTQFAMAQQDVRYYLNGLLLEIDKGSIRSIATDGHRLAFCEIEIDLNPSEVTQVILPRKGVMELGKILEDDDSEVRIEIGANHLRVTLNEMQFTTKLIDGKFPDYTRVIPRKGDKLITINRDLVKQAFARASILSNEKYRGIRLTLLPGLLQAQAHNPEMEEAEEEVEIDYQGEQLVIGFNVTYLLDAINAIVTEDINIELGDANSSCLITPQGETTSCKYVVMPMRL